MSRNAEYDRRKRERYKTVGQAPDCKSHEFGRARAKPKFRYGIWASAHSGYIRNGIPCWGYSL